MSEKDDKKWIATSSAEGYPVIEHDDYGSIAAWTNTQAKQLAHLLNTGVGPKPELPAEVVELLEYLNNENESTHGFVKELGRLSHKCAHLLPPKHRCIREGCEGVPRTDFVKAMGLYTVECKQCGILGNFQESESEAWKAFYQNKSGMPS